MHRACTPAAVYGRENIRKITSNYIINFFEPYSHGCMLYEYKKHIKFTRGMAADALNAYLTYDDNLLN